MKIRLKEGFGNVLIGSVAFGIWQQNLWAGIFMWLLLALVLDFIYVKAK